MAGDRPGVEPIPDDERLDNVWSDLIGKAEDGSHTKMTLEVLYGIELARRTERDELREELGLALKRVDGLRTQINGMTQLQQAEQHQAGEPTRTAKVP